MSGQMIKPLENGQSITLSYAKVEYYLDDILVQEVFDQVVVGGAKMLQSAEIQVSKAPPNVCLKKRVRVPVVGIPSYTNFKASAVESLDSTFRTFKVPDGAEVPSANACAFEAPVTEVTAFTAQVSLEHVEETQPEKISTHACDECGRLLRSRYGLKRHRLIHEKNKKLELDKFGTYLACKLENAI